MTDQHIAVAMSGGGHRASLFGLGALLYLVDAGKGPELSQVSSVSGGSLTNGYVGLYADLTTVEPGEFWSTTGQFVRRLVRRGTLFGYPLTYLLLAAIALSVVAAVVVSFLCPPWISILVWIAAVVLAAVLAQQRSAVAARSFDSALFHGAPLNDMKDSVSHVLCATDLQTAEQVYFGGSFVYSWRCGWGTPGYLRLSRAVQSSAALPGPFNVVSLPVRRHNFPGECPLTHFKLTDGGVYDNMGTEWPIRLSRRLDEAGAPPSLKDADELIVVNASAAGGITPRRSVNTPLLGEIAALLAAKDVMYDQTTAVRRRLLDLRFRSASAGAQGGPLKGSIVQIGRSPFELPDSFKNGNDELAVRARNAIGWLGEDSRAAWQETASGNAGTKTTLSKIPATRAEALIRHAYILTMVNSHVLLDYPLLPISADKFGSLLD